MPTDAARLLSAATFAASKHADQRRKNVAASPYINHPLAVATVLANEGEVNDIELLTAALLHDTVEDTETTPSEIESLFGDEVCRLVAEVTDDKSLPKERRKQLQIESAMHKSNRAKQLKIADKICNIRDIDGESPQSWELERKTQYLRWAQQVIDGCRGVNDKLDRLFDQVLRQAENRLRP